MGDRISIQFKNGQVKSPVFFSHCDGKELLSSTNQYLLELKHKVEGCFTPLDRLDPQTVIVDFIRWLTKDHEQVKSNYYLGTDSEDGDNSDNGHYVFELDGIQKTWRMY